jgi:hypothetical protein
MTTPIVISSDGTNEGTRISIEGVDISAYISQLRWSHDCNRGHSTLELVVEAGLVLDLSRGTEPEPVATSLLKALPANTTVHIHGCDYLPPDPEPAEPA